ncbi:LacI family transcriptional regulator [Novosphingobium kunmingense]|uniref:LacI family transcriptional regulator n=1 Tax=Novosphingobium kunmingense TaxID=1211806 RepID=A0A2N0H3F5_9SPHN|nr:LacI family DNA-binding transcriptional regulator [Novosphingobium kunmingense]PKB13476.1 LacI family transcriptional regulator [Novosphingobium kunmingense]
MKRVRNLTQLAALAGVNPGTVSRALADSPLVKRETRERIQGLARDHGYRPNLMARRLRVQETGVIGIVVPLGHEERQYLSDPFFMTIVGCLAGALSEKGYDVMLSRVIPDDEDWLDRIIGSGMLDGVLIIGQSNQFDTIERVAAGYRPLVVWGAHTPLQRHCSVGVDNRMGGRLAGECLIAAGRKRLAFMGDSSAPELRERFLGLCEAAQAAGLAAPLELGAHLAIDGMADEVAAHIDRVREQVDGIAAGSDLIAMHCVAALADRRLVVPRDVSVIGFDDVPLAEQTVPRLTTISQSITTGARTMVNLLCDRIAGREAQSVEMQPFLVRRDTV